MEPIDQQPEPTTAGPTTPLDPPSTSEMAETLVAEPTPPPGAPAAPATPPPAPASSKKSGYWRWFGAAALLAAAVATGGVLASNDSPDPDPAAAPTTVTSIAPAVSTPTTVADQQTAEINPILLDASTVGNAVIPSVVTVQINGAAGNGVTTTLGSGSGVVYDDLGHIVTNDHVVTAGSSYEIVLADGRVYPAELVGTDPTTDLAVLSVSAEDLEPIALGSSDDLAVGDPAVAVGSPLGLRGGPSLTVGVISAFGREVQTSSTTALFGMLQTDAPITQGSSGGALVDGIGQLVGITTAVGVSDVGIEGIGFATPVEVVTRVADEIIADGAASSPYLGIFGETALEDTTDGGSAPIGVVIGTVEPNTAAASAGLSEGDVIAAVNDDAVKTMDELVALLRRYGAGVEVEISLDGGPTVMVTLGQRPDA